MRFLSLLLFLLIFMAVQCQSPLEIQKIFAVVEKGTKLDLFGNLKNSGIFKVLGLTNPAVGLVLEAFVIIFDLINPKTAEKDVNEQLEGINKKLDEISSLIKTLSKVTEKELAELNINLKMTPFTDATVAMNLFERRFRNIFSTFNDISQTEEMRKKLTKVIEEQESAALEAKIVEYFDAKSGTERSTIDAFFEYGSVRKNNFISTVPSSTAKLIQEFYFDMLRRIIKSYAFREIAINLKHWNASNDMSRDLELMLTDKQNTLNAFRYSFGNYSQRVSDEHLKAFVNVNPSGNAKFIKFRSVFQTFIVRELDVNDGYCNKLCIFLKPIEHNNMGCKGTIRDCSGQPNKFLLKMVDLQYKVPLNDRIYWSYNYNSEGWKGNYIEKPNYSLRNFRYWASTLGKDNCDVCLCTCDQHNHPNTMRRVYAGKVEAQPGFVVTGVRFVEHNKAIALQIQTAKLLPMAVVDRNTINWQELPNDRNFITLTYQNPYSFGLTDDLKFEINSTIVTGLKFVEDGRIIKLQVYGKFIVDINSTTLSADEFLASPTIAQDVVKTGGQLGVKINDINFFVKTSGKLEFRKSDEATDAGQNYVPYFDAHDVTFLSTAPITSIGLIHYTNNEDFAGYIKPTIKSLNMAIWA